MTDNAEVATLKEHDEKDALAWIMKNPYNPEWTCKHFYNLYRKASGDEVALDIELFEQIVYGRGLRQYCIGRQYVWMPIVTYNDKTQASAKRWIRAHMPLRDTPCQQHYTRYVNSKNGKNIVTAHVFADLMKLQGYDAVWTVNPFDAPIDRAAVILEKCCCVRSFRIRVVFVMDGYESHLCDHTAIRIGSICYPTAFMTMCLHAFSHQFNQNENGDGYHGDQKAAIKLFDKLVHKHSLKYSDAPMMRFSDSEEDTATIGEDDSDHASSSSSDENESSSDSSDESD